MFARMKFQHEVDERAAQTRPCAIQNCETRARDFARAVEIEKPQRSSKINVISRLEIKLRRLAPATFFTISSLVLSDRHALVRNVRKRGEKFAHPRFSLITRTVKLRNSFFQLADFTASRVSF